MTLSAEQQADPIECPACKGSGREDKRDYCGARVRPHQVDCNECVGTGYYEHHLPPVRCHSYPLCGCPALELCVPYLEQALEQAGLDRIAKAVADERAQIVAWLRSYGEPRATQHADSIESWMREAKKHRSSK